jgi:hypothetical protein
VAKAPSQYIDMSIYLDPQAPGTGLAQGKEAAAKLGIQHVLIIDVAHAGGYEPPSASRSRIVPLDALEQLVAQSR